MVSNGIPLDEDDEDNIDEDNEDAWMWAFTVMSLAVEKAIWNWMDNYQRCQETLRLPLLVHVSCELLL